MFLSFNIQPLDGNTARIVYLLTLNGRASRQVRRLIKRLYDDRNYIYIHVDSRQDYLFREMKAIEALFPQTGNEHINKQIFLVAPIGNLNVEPQSQGLSQLLMMCIDWIRNFEIEHK